MEKRLNEAPQLCGVDGQLFARAVHRARELMRAYQCASAHALGFCQATSQGHSAISVDDGCKIQRGYFAVAHDLMQ